MLRVSGELDLAGAAVLREHILDAFGQRPARITIDMQRVTFLDAVSVGVLAQAAESARSHGIAFAVVNPSPEVRRVLGLTSSDLELADAPERETPPG